MRRLSPPTQITGPSKLKKKSPGPAPPRPPRDAPAGGAEDARCRGCQGGARAAPGLRPRAGLRRRLDEEGGRPDDGEQPELGSSSPASWPSLACLAAVPALPHALDRARSAPRRLPRRAQSRRLLLLRQAHRRGEGRVAHAERREGDERSSVGHGQRGLDGEPLARRGLPRSAVRRSQAARRRGAGRRRRGAGRRGKAGPLRMLRGGEQWAAAEAPW